MAKSERPSRKRATPRIPTILKPVIAAAVDKQAVDLVVLDLKKDDAFTDYFVIASGTNVRQVQAIADAIVERLRQDGLKPGLVEGYQRGQWILIDYFDFIVHVFMPVTREFYALERLWGNAKKIEVPTPSNI